MATSFHGTLTLTSANTNYNLYTLMAAVRVNVGHKFAFLKIVPDEANTQAVLKGDGSLSATEYEDSLATGDIWERTSGSGYNQISATTIFLRSSGASQKVHVEAQLA